MDDFHVLRTIKYPVRVACFHKYPETSITDPDNDSKQQSDADKSEDGEDHRPQRNVGPALRLDHSDQPVFQKKTGTLVQSNVTALVELVYLF